MTTILARSSSPSPRVVLAFSLIGVFVSRCAARRRRSDITAENTRVDIFGSGNALFAMQPGSYYIGVYAKSFSSDEPGLFGLTLNLRDPAAVPVPGALWLLASGMLGFADTFVAAPSEGRWRLRSPIHEGVAKWTLRNEKQRTHGSEPRSA